MGRTARGVFGLVSIVLVLGLSTPAAAAVPPLPDGVPPSSLRHASPAAFAERVTSGGADRPPARGTASLGHALELTLLAAIFGIAVACYAATRGKPGS